MQLEQALESVVGFMVPSEFGRLREHVDPAWIEEALWATGTASLRRRRLPAEQAIWLVLGMALLRRESIDRVAKMLDLALPSTDGQPIAKSSLAQARARLGEDPLSYLFAVTADRWATGSADRHAWRGLTLHGIDGTTLRVPDSPENWAAFGGQCGNGTRNGSAYPLVRMVAVMTLRSHILSAVHFANYSTGETSLSDGFWNELPDNSLTIADRNFLVADDLTRLERSGRNRHWLTRSNQWTAGASAAAFRMLSTTVPTNDEGVGPRMLIDRSSLRRTSWADMSQRLKDARGFCGPSQSRPRL